MLGGNKVYALQGGTKPTPMRRKSRSPDENNTMKRFFVCLVLLMWGFSAHGAENSSRIDLEKKDAVSPKTQEKKKNSPTSCKKKPSKKSRSHLLKDTKDDKGWDEGVSIYEQKEGC